MIKPLTRCLNLLRTKPRLRRAIILGLTVPPCLLGLVCSFAAYRIYAANRAGADEIRYPLVPVPTASQSILVFAPHCDDETLGAAGLMRQAHRQKCPVHVVIITNGDGFRVGVAREYHEISVAPKDFVRYATMRQGETRTALKVLGLTSDQITFLGYPDRGLMPMWTTNWSAETPFRSSFTQNDHSPYPNSPTLHAPYAGASLLADLKRQMQADKPTDIYVTHPDDDHPDHAAASVFVRTALEQLQADGVPWAQTAHLHYYLVHHGDWPVPQGLHEDAALPPPAQMVALSTDWEQLPLSRRDTMAKYAAIKRYRSQVDLTGRFLFSFARKNELFGTAKEGLGSSLAQVRAGTIHLDGTVSDWKGISPIVMDPVADNIVRAFQPSADIVRVFACRDTKTLFVRMDLQRRLLPQVAYSLALRPTTNGVNPPKPLLISVQPGPEGSHQPIPNVPGGTFAWHGAILEMALPLESAGLSHPAADEHLYLSAATRFANLAVDKTGFFGVAVTPHSSSLRTASR